MSNSHKISIRIDPDEVKAQVERLRSVRNGASKAIMRAMNRAAVGMVTDGAAEVSAIYTVSKSDVRGLKSSDPTKRKPSTVRVVKASGSNLSAGIDSRGSGFSLARFKSRRNKSPGQRGASPAWAQVRQSGSGGYIRASSNRSSAFMAPTGKGRDSGIFVRTGQRTVMSKGRHKGSVREQIRLLRGPAIPEMLDNSGVRSAIQTEAVRRFHKELDHQVEHLLEKSNK